MRAEVRAAALLTTIIGAYTAAVLGRPEVSAAQYFELLSDYAPVAVQLWVFIGLICLVVGLLRDWRCTGELARPFPVLGSRLRERWAYDRWVSLLTPLVIFAGLITSFNLFKHLVLPTAGYHLDAIFAAADRAIFLGSAPSEVTHALVASPWATAVIDTGYHAWFLPMTLGVMLCAFVSATPELRLRYLLSYCLCWTLIGSVLAYALPAAGPAFYGHLAAGPDAFEALMGRLEEQQAIIRETWPSYEMQALRNQTMLLAIRSSEDPQIGGGISAMPSMHIALATLFACGAFSLKRWLGFAMTGYALFIWFGSVHLGWHYAVDGLVAAPLAVAIWVGAGVVSRLVTADQQIAGRATAMA